jgi:hypothetical protein
MRNCTLRNERRHLRTCSRAGPDDAGVFEFGKSIVNGSGVVIDNA